MRPASKVCVMAALFLAAAVPGCRKSEKPEAAAADSEALKEARRRPPFGLIDAPREGDIVASGSHGTGWALDDSGVAKVEVALDNPPGSPAQLNLPFPGVRQAYPTYPGSDRSGFSFTMPSVAAGPHLLIVTITGKDGGKTELKRHIQIR